MATNVSTVNKTGEDYATISAWESDTDNDLVTSETIEVLEVYKDDGMITASVTISGATTSADYYRKITVPTASRHNGTAGTGAKVHSTDMYTATFRVFAENYTVIEWLEVTRTTTTPDGDGNCCILIGGQYNTARYNIVHDGIATTSGTIAGIRGKDQTSGIDTWVYGNIIYDNSGAGISFGNYNSMDNYAYNNTVYNNGGLGITGGNDKSLNIYVNNIVMENGSGDLANAHASSENNIVTGGTVTFVSTTDGSEDFHITSASTDAIDQGTDLSALFDIDIDGKTRSGTWDIGADEYVSAIKRRLLMGCGV